jgi:predicted GIY-YIG superfamily endonuclease
MFIRHRHGLAALVEQNDVAIQTIPCLHHDKSAAFSRFVHPDYWKPHAARVGTQKQIVPGFTSRYNLTRLVYYECFFYPDAAINREKEIKGWRRSKKIRLIESMNPHWYDLAEHWGDVYKPRLAEDSREIPRPAGENAGIRNDAFGEDGNI